jgi:hypothetical protein
MSAKTISSFAACLLFLLGSGCTTPPDALDREALQRYLDKTYKPSAPTVDAYLSELRSVRRDLKPWRIDPDVVVGKTKPAPPQPLPGRLIAKIAPSEISASFKPTPARFNLRELIQARVLPNGLPVTQVSYLGLSRDQRVLLRVDLAREHGDAELEQALRQTHSSLFRLSLRPAGRQRSAVVAYNPRVVPADFSTFFHPELFHLQAGSPLRPVFTQAGVVNMRRVFNAVERRDPDGTIKVVPFKELLALAKAQNPARAQRAWDYVHDKSLSAILAAYQEHFGRPMQPVTDAEIIRVREALKPYLRKPVAVPDNMENYFLLTLRPGMDAAALERAANDLGKYKAIQNISLDYPVNLATNDTAYPDQWGLENTGTFMGTGGGAAGFDIGINTAWTSRAQQRPVVVAVLDDGIHKDLNEFRNRMWSNPHELPNGVDDDGNGFVDDVNGITTGVFVDDAQTLGAPAALFGTHGTMVAGVIAAEASNSYGIAGVAGGDNVQLMNISMGFFSPDGTPCGFAETAQAVLYAMAPSSNSAFPLSGADVVNMSYGGNCIKCWLPHDLIMAALSTGTVLVAAAGNRGQSYLTLPPDYPAALPGVITVGGSRRDGRWYTQSTYGYLIDLVAPAQEIVTTTFDPANLSQTQALLTNTAANPPKSGTSMAAAFVSGAAAVLLGRFSDLTGPFMNDWLRAKALDIVDPLGDGTSHPGEDAHTGAGMLDAGNAATAALVLDDRPIDVELLIKPMEILVKEIDAYVPSRPFNVAGSPLLGVRVQGPTLTQWVLSYGVGEFPTSWTTITSGTTQQDYQTNSYGELTTGGVSPFNTDSLVNGQLYKMRLSATNRAGTVFQTSALFVPSRVAITFPEKNHVIVPGRGWLPLAGHAHIPVGGAYSVNVTNAAGLVLWNSGPISQPYSEYPARSGVFLLMNNKPSQAANPHHYCGYAPAVYTATTQAFPAASVLPHGFVNYILRVGSEWHSVRLFVDNTNFTPTYWPIINPAVNVDRNWPGADYMDIPDYSQLSTCFHNHTLRLNDWLVVNPATAAGGARLLVAHVFGLTALDSAGNRLWQWFNPDTVYSNLGRAPVFADAESDGVNEVIVAGVGILNGVNGAVKYPWPTIEGPIHSVLLENVVGDQQKELVVGHRVGTTGKVSVFSLQGQLLHTRDFPNATITKLRSTDTNGDGRGEILVVPTGQMMHGDLSFVTGWSSQGAFQDAEFAREGTSLNVVLTDGNTVTVRTITGATRAGGWPVTGSAFKVGRTPPSTNDFVVVYSDRLKALTLSNTSLAGSGEIMISEPVRGFELHNVDSADTAPEILVMVDRYKQDPADDEVVGYFLEAYKLNGTRKADTDGRWPINLANAIWLDDDDFHPTWGKQFALGDITFDGRAEVFQLLRIAPYSRDHRPGNAGIKVEVMSPD